jgi:HSP20 family molecular chaperone IbpA
MIATYPRTLMWVGASELIDRAERLYRQFFQPTAAPLRDLCSEPPVDIIKTDFELLIGVALPGVNSGAVKVTVGTDEIIVTGFRRANVIRAAAWFIGRRSPPGDSTVGSLFQPPTSSLIRRNSPTAA